MSKPTSFTDSSRFFQYREICRQCVIDEKMFNNFRRTPKYTEVIDNLRKEYGTLYINKIKEYILNVTFSDFTQQFKFNDIVGSPTLYSYGEDGFWSPVTLRYIKTLLMLEDLFGSLDGLEIAEIGGGYGGQSAIIQSYVTISTYHIFDLNEVVGLINKYLSKCYSFDLSSTTVIMNQDQLAELNHITPDIVISDYSFSEMTCVTQDTYFEKVIRHSKYGHMTLNFIRYPNNDAWPLQKYIDKFKSIGKNVTIMSDEILAPKSNCILLWGNIDK